MRYRQRLTNLLNDGFVKNPDLSVNNIKIYNNIYIYGGGGGM